MIIVMVAAMLCQSCTSLYTILASKKKSFLIETEFLTEFNYS